MMTNYYNVVFSSAFLCAINILLLLIYVLSIFIDTNFVTYAIYLN